MRFPLSPFLMSIFLFLLSFFWFPHAGWSHLREQWWNYFGVDMFLSLFCLYHFFSLLMTQMRKMLAYAVETPERLKQKKRWWAWLAVYAAWTLVGVLTMPLPGVILCLFFTGREGYRWRKKNRKTVTFF